MHAHINLHLSDDDPPATAMECPSRSIAVTIGDLHVYGSRAQLIALAMGIQSAVFGVSPLEAVPPHSLGARVEWTTDGAVPTEVRTDA